MRLLFLTPYLPSPPRSGGAARIHGLISQLAERHEVALLSFRRPGEDLREELAATGRYAADVVVIENPRFALSSQRRRMAQLRSLFSTASFERRTHHLATFQSALDDFVARWQPEAIVVEFAQMGYRRFPPDVPVVVDAHNVEHELLRRMAAGGSAFRRCYALVNGAKLRRDEQALLARADAVAATSDPDRGALLALAPGARVTVVPNGVSTEEFAPIPDAPVRTDLVFFGAMDYYPNSDAVLRFHRAVWPRLRAAFPDLRFAVVGREPPAAVRALDGRDGISVTGQVDDLRPWIAGARVVVVPLRFGSGTRLKVLEALAMGRPVVSTGIGVEGLDVRHGRHLLVAEDPQRFADSVVAVLGDPELANRLGKAGRRLVQDRYDWREIADTFEQVITGAVERCRAGTTQL